MEAGVEALAVGADGTLYAGGRFTEAGGAPADYIARWDGTSWSALGSGMNDTVLALAVGPDGTLYAGGLFTTAGGVPIPYVARWDGTSWSALGSGVNAAVWALATLAEGDLYVGGDFSEAGDKVSYYIGRWRALPDDLVVATVAYEYELTDGSSGSGTWTLLSDGSFTDATGGTGQWRLPPSEILFVQYEAGQVCEAQFAGTVAGGGQVAGEVACQDGSGVEGTWQGTIE
jgi:hypothetical protein